MLGLQLAVCMNSVKDKTRDVKNDSKGDLDFFTFAKSSNTGNELLVS